jgi:S1-C subfamily serine protease
MEAASLGHVEIVKLLIEAKADVSLKCINPRHDGETALYRAVLEDKATIVDLLVKAGAKGDPKEIRLGIEMRRAACQGFKFKEGQGYPNYPGNAGGEGALTIAEVLKMGADINAQDPKGYTPLMYAANLGLVENVKTLLAHGADPMLETYAGGTCNGGVTALSLAEAESSYAPAERLQVVALLRAYLAKKKLASSPLLPEQPKEEVPRQAPFAVVVEKIKPALVFIQEPKEKGAAAAKRPKFALGIIIDPKGILVTNHSAIKGMKSSEVLLHDGRVLPVKALLSDPDLDLAIIKVEDGKPLPYAEVGDSEKVKEGDWIIALGAPWTTAVDEPLLVAAGLISGKVRGTKKDEHLFLVDTSIGPGCSPGPLITREGKFVGLVVSRDLSPRSNGAIPSNRVKKHAADWAKEKWPPNRPRATGATPRRRQTAIRGRLGERERKRGRESK